MSDGVVDDRTSLTATHQLIGVLIYGAFWGVIAIGINTHTDFGLTVKQAFSLIVTIVLGESYRLAFVLKTWGSRLDCVLQKIVLLDVKRAGTALPVRIRPRISRACLRTISLLKNRVCSMMCSMRASWLGNRQPKASIPSIQIFAICDKISCSSSPPLEDIHTKKKAWG